MLKDITNYFPIQEHKYSTGLFNQKTASKIQIHKILSDNMSLFDMYNGLCMLYMSYFITQKPDWKIMKLTKNNSLIHVFATKNINNINYFADARGITDNCIIFFKDYACSTEKLIIQPVTNLPELDFYEIIPFAKAYKICYSKGYL